MTQFPIGIVTMALLLDFEISSEDLRALALAMPVWFRNTDANMRAANGCQVTYGLEPVDMDGDGSLSDNWPLLHRLEDEAYGYALVDARDALGQDSFVPAFDALLLGRNAGLSQQDIETLRSYDFNEVETCLGWTIARRRNSVGRGLASPQPGRTR